VEVGNMLIFPNILRFAYSMHWRVPQDDTHTHVFTVTCDPNTPPESPEALENPPIEDHPLQYRPDGRHALHTIWAQDRMAWETQGAIVDRGREHLGSSDKGILLLRQTLKEQIERVQQGLDPLGLTRDPELEIIEIPLDQYLEGDQPESAPNVATMSDYLDERQVWFEVPEGAARSPGSF
jgi:5,5'-dehydrodivanillate O-demethylase oxygenase subunit